MDDRLVAIIKTHLPPGSDVTKIYKADGEVKADVSMGGMAMTVSIKKNHAGELYIE
jgi:hypothetical protein